MLQEQQVLCTAGPSLWPLLVTILISIFILFFVLISGMAVIATSLGNRYS